MLHIIMNEQEFLTTISPTFAGTCFQIPPSALSLQERQQQRLLFRNNRTLHKSVCAKTWVSMISMYHPESGYTIYDQSVRRWDDWDAREYAQDFTKNKSFTEQFSILMKRVPRINLINTEHENSEYCNFSWRNKNCYMLDTSGYNENCFYGSRLFNSSSCIDCFWLNDCDLCYESWFCIQCFKCFRCFNVVNSSNCYACVDCFGCKDCFGCVGIENAQWMIYNIQYTKEEYEQLVNQEKTTLQHEPSLVFNKLDMSWSHMLQCEWSVWKYLQHCQTSIDCFASKNLEDCGWITNASDLQNCHDIDNNDRSQLNYQLVWGESNYLCCFADICWFGKELWYCSLCMYCEHCFGCVGLKRQKYCIFNRQYKPEAYEKKVAEIIAHMQTTWERWYFFHHSLSPFAYNETTAQDIYPLRKEGALSLGYTWSDRNESSSYTWATLSWDELNELDIHNDIILDSVISCSISWKVFRFVKKEVEIYKRLWILLPKYHSEVRYKKRWERMW